METLRKIRRERDITQAQLAEMAGVSQELICQMEQGYRAGSDRARKQIAKALRLRPEQIQFEVTR